MLFGHLVYFEPIFNMLWRKVSAFTWNQLLIKEIDISLAIP